MREPHFTSARSYGLYAAELRAAILQLNFHRREALDVRLGGLLLEPWLALAGDSSSCQADLIIPVPLHHSRERERGYNQARLLAKGLLRAMKKLGGGSHPKFDGRTLVRSRATAPQSGLTLQGRSENVRRAFEVIAPARARGLDMILIDDVMTSGATASACALALRAAGARRVVVLTLARATPQFPDVAPVIV